MTSILFAWRKRLLGPSAPRRTVQHVLMVLSMHMDTSGESCFPSIDQLAAETGRHRATVMIALDEAEEGGWIDRSELGRRGKGWRRTEYVAVLWDESRQDSDSAPYEVVVPADHGEEVVVVLPDHDPPIVVVPPDHIGSHPERKPSVSEEAKVSVTHTETSSTRNETQARRSSSPCRPGREPARRSVGVESSLDADLNLARRVMARPSLDRFQGRLIPSLLAQLEAEIPLSGPQRLKLEEAARQHLAPVEDATRAETQARARTEDYMRSELKHRRKVVEEREQDGLDVPDHLRETIVSLASRWEAP